LEALYSVGKLHWKDYYPTKWHWSRFLKKKKKKSLFFLLLLLLCLFFRCGRARVIKWLALPDSEPLPVSSDRRSTNRSWELTRGEITFLWSVNGEITRGGISPSAGQFHAWVIGSERRRAASCPPPPAGGLVLFLWAADRRLAAWGWTCAAAVLPVLKETKPSWALICQTGGNIQVMAF